MPSSITATSTSASNHLHLDTGIACGVCGVERAFMRCSCPCKMNVCYYSDCLGAFCQHQESSVEQLIGTNGRKRRKLLHVLSDEEKILIRVYEELTGQKWTSKDVSERALETLHIIVQYMIRMAFEQNAKEDIETIRAICSGSKEALDYCRTVLPHDEVKFIKFLRTPNTSEEIVEHIIFFEPKEFQVWTILKKNALLLGIGDASNRQVESSTYEIQLKGEYWTMLYAVISINEKKWLVHFLKHYRFAEEDFQILRANQNLAVDHFFYSAFRGIQEFDLFPGEFLGFSYAAANIWPLKILADSDFRFAYYFLLNTDLLDYHTPLLFTRHYRFFLNLMELYFNDIIFSRMGRLIGHPMTGALMSQFITWLKVAVKYEKRFLKHLRLHIFRTEEDIIEEIFWSDMEWQQSTFENAESPLLFTMYVFGDFYEEIYLVRNHSNMGDTIENIENTFLELQVIYTVFNTKFCYEKQLQHIRKNLDFEVRKGRRITAESLIRKRTYLTVQLAIVKENWLKSLGMFRLIFDKHRTLFFQWLQYPLYYVDFQTMYKPRLFEIDKELNRAERSMAREDFYYYGDE